MAGCNASRCRWVCVGGGNSNWRKVESAKGPNQKSGPTTTKGIVAVFSGEESMAKIMKAMAVAAVGCAGAFGALVGAGGAEDRKQVVGVLEFIKVRRETQPHSV